MRTHLFPVLFSTLLLAAGYSASADQLDAVLDAQPADVKARYQYRNPGETLRFFGIQPGMTVVEALPGGGWYTKILLPYLGREGHVIGADYAKSMWPLFGSFSDEFVAAKETWVEDWTAEANTWRNEDSATISAFVLGDLPADMEGTADAVLFIRALHNLSRFENQGGYLTSAINDAYRVLKPGGVLGIVQHHARDDRPDAWADGSRGYLKKSFVIDMVQAAGFEFAGESDINANPNDQPGDSDVVWRLPPSARQDRVDADTWARVSAIGESNRMTLKFVKPGGPPRPPTVIGGQE